MDDDTPDDPDCPICGSGDCHGHFLSSDVPAIGTEPPPVDPPKVWTEDMGEISGFGGAYEECCRRMFFAGAAWFDAHPLAEPRFMGSPQVFGIIVEDNWWAKELTKVLLAAAGPEGCTGAMHQAVVGHCLAYRRYGWEGYQRELHGREAREAQKKAEEKPDA
jgi:hypothetical protein